MTAVVMPVYNEATARVYASLEAMIEEIRGTGLIGHFEFFILSDSTQPDAWVAEERAFYALRERVGPSVRIWYRHRKRNVGRKAGNIEDFVTRWGGGYEHMLVLDADSLMTGECITRLAAAMEADPDAGHHPVAAADHQPQHAVRPPAAVRRQDLRPDHRHGPGRLVRAARAITGATTRSSARAPSPRIAACPRCRASRPSAATS